MCTRTTTAFGASGVGVGGTDVGVNTGRVAGNVLVAVAPGVGV